MVVVSACTAAAAATEAAAAAEAAAAQGRWCSHESTHLLDCVLWPMSMVVVSAWTAAAAAAATAATDGGSVNEVGGMCWSVYSLAPER
jgi:hypothetical protein